MSDILDDMNNDYIDEALAYNGGRGDGPTPPKQGKESPLVRYHSCCFMKLFFFRISLVGSSENINYHFYNCQMSVLIKKHNA